MSQQDLLERTIRSLESAGIEYMVTGSVASSLQGEPRSTHDIDLVVRLEDDQVDSILSIFPSSEFYVAKEAVCDAIRRGSMFNVLAIAEGDKLDFWVLTPSPFDQERFRRRREEEVFGSKIRVSAPEDTILMKLVWSNQSGGSEKQYTDALRVYEIQGSALDQDYLDQWARDLGISSLLDRLRREAQPVD